MDKNHLLDWYRKCKAWFISFSISIRYIAIIMIFVFGYLGSSNFAGFGVDSNGLLYIGRKTHIEVYRNGECMGIVSIPMQKEGWYMGVSEDDTIILCAGAEEYSIKADGTVLEMKDQNPQIATLLAHQRTIKGNDGNYYQLRHKWICPVIETDGTVVYCAPFVDVMARVSWIGLFISFPGMCYEGVAAIKNKRKTGDGPVS